jgi:O-antigen/teichoic acid export membrane protein
MQRSLSSSRVVAHNALFNSAGYILGVAYLFFLIPMILAHLGMEQFGLWSLILALTGYLGLADAGMGSSFVRYIAEYVAVADHTRVNKVVHLGLFFYAVLSIFLFGVGILAFPFLYALLGIPPHLYEIGFNVFVLSLLSFATMSISAVLASVLAGIQRLDALNILVACTLVSRFAAISITLHLGYGVVGLMIADLSISVLSLVPVLLVTRKLFPDISFRWLGYDHELMKTLLKFGSQLQVSKFAEMVQAQFDKFLLTRFTGLPAVSTYDFGSRPLGRLRSLPLTAVSSLIPAIASLDALGNEDRIRSAFVRSTRYLSVVSIPIFVFVAWFAEEIIQAWLGVSVDRAGDTLRILSGTYCLAAILSALGLISQGKGEPQYQMRAMLVQAGMNMVLSTILVIQYGYFGAVAGTCIAGVMGSLLFFQSYGKKIVQHPFSILRRAIAKPIFSVVPAVPAGVLIYQLISTLSPEGRLSSIGGLMGSGIAYMVVYMVMLNAVKTFDDDDRGFVENILPNRLRMLMRKNRT